MASTHLSVTPALAFMPDTSFPSCMPPVPFKLLPQCWSSEEVNLSKCVCVCSLRGRGTAWESRSFFHQLSPCSFCSQKLWGLTFLALEPWAGRPNVGLGLLAPDVSLPDLYPTHVGVGPAYSASLPLLPFCMDVISLIL